MRDPFKISILSVKHCGKERDVGYGIDLPPDIKNNILIDDINECVWIKKQGGKGVRVYPYENFHYMTWISDN